MKKILAIAWKDTLVRFSGRSEWLFFIVLPVVFTVILAGFTGQSGSTRTALAVVDEAHTPLSRALVSALQQSDALDPAEQTLAAAEAQLARRQVPAVLVIPAGFDLAQLAQGTQQLDLRQLPGNMDAMLAARAVQSVVGRLSSAAGIARGSVAAAEQARPFASAAERQAYFEAAFQAAQSQLSQTAEPMKVVSGATINLDDPRANSSAGQLITWVFVPLIGISSLFAAERQNGTLRRLLTTPTHQATYLLGTILGQVVTALVQMLILVGFGMLVLKVNWGHAPLALAILLAATALAAAALGTALGTFVATEGQAGGISIMVGMVLALLGGCWYPLELFPPLIRTIVNVLPTTWAMQGMIDLVLGGKGLTAVLPAVGVLLGFAVVFLAVGIRRFRYE